MLHASSIVSLMHSKDASFEDKLGNVAAFVQRMQHEELAPLVSRRVHQHICITLLHWCTQQAAAEHCGSIGAALQLWQAIGTLAKDAQVRCGIRS